MLTKLIELCLRYRILVIIGFVLIALLSVYSVKNAKVDAIANIGENQQIVFTKWAGRSAKDIEQQITYPLSIHLQGMPGVDRIRASSSFGFSTVYIIFKEDIDFYWSRSRVLEKISTSKEILPRGVSPTLGPDATGLGQVFWYTIENSVNNPNPLSLAKLRSLQDFYVKFHLQSVEGVSEVASVGGFIKEYQIDVDPNKIIAFNIHFPQIIKAIKNSNIDVGAEVIEQGDREYIVRGVGFFKSISDIEEVVVGLSDGAPIRVKDLADVQIGPAFRRGALDKNGLEVLGGIVTMRYGENPTEVISRIKEKLKQIKEGLPSGVEIIPFYDRSELVDKTMGTVTWALSEQILITTFVIILFLMHFKSSLLVSLTLPFGVGISFILMKLLDIDSNIMSLSGIVIAIGSMVDMGIIMTENIHSKLADNKNENTNERISLIFESAKEISPAILTAVLTTIVTFIPVFALTHAEGKLFGPLAWAKTLAMFGSVFVAIILIPVLAVFLLKGNLKKSKDSAINQTIVRFYSKTLNYILNKKKLFFLIPFTIMILGAFSYTQLEGEFMPSLNEGEILYMPVTTPDVSMTKARELLSYTDEVILKHPLVVNVIGKLGRADTSLDPAPISMFETIIKLAPMSEWPNGISIYDIMNDLDQKLQIPGLVNSWDFPIQTRIGMISTGLKTQVALKIFGDDLSELENVSENIAKILKEIPGAAGVYPERITGKPYIEFKIDRVAASRFGVNTGDINSIIQTAIGGMKIDQMYEKRHRYPIRVRYKKDLRNDIEQLKNILIATKGGQHIPISQLADIVVTTGPAMIQSENGILRSTVQLNVKDIAASTFVSRAQMAFNEKLVLPEGVSIEWAGKFEDEKRANQKLLILIPLSLLINFFIIYLNFRSFSLSAIVLTSIPVAASGGLILLYLSGFKTSVAVWVGFIALFGIAVDDGVVMMSYLKESLSKATIDNYRQLKDVILEAGVRRIRPLLMTSVTTILALMPILWSNGHGSEVMRPMAIPLLGGMSIVLISLFIVPVVFGIVYEKKLNLK